MSERPQRLAFFLTAITALMMVGLIAAILLLRHELRREPDAPINEETVDALRTLSVRLDRMDMAHREQMAALEQKIGAPTAPTPEVVAAPEPATEQPAPQSVVEPVVPAPEVSLQEHADEIEMTPALESFDRLHDKAYYGVSYTKELDAFEKIVGDRFAEERAVLRRHADQGTGTTTMRSHERFVYLLSQVESGMVQREAVEDDSVAGLNQKLKGFITVRKHVEPTERSEIPAELRLRAVTAIRDHEAKEELIELLSPEEQATFEEWREEAKKYREVSDALGTIEIGVL